MNEMVDESDTIVVPMMKQMMKQNLFCSSDETKASAQRQDWKKSHQLSERYYRVQLKAPLKPLGTI